MINNQRQKNINVYTFGFKSRFAELIWNHPWFSLLFFYIFTGFIFICVESKIEKVIWALEVVLPYYVGCFVLSRYFLRNSCYRVVIDNDQQIIRFYVMFNKGIVTVKMSDIKIVIGRNFNCVVNGKKFVLMNNLLHDVVALLPESTEIKFVGFWGRLWEKDLIKRNRKLRPGKRLG